VRSARTALDGETFPADAAAVGRRLGRLVMRFPCRAVDA
jgi:hypothetical protein